MRYPSNSIRRNPSPTKAKNISAMATVMLTLKKPATTTTATMAPNSHKSKLLDMNIRSSAVFHLASLRRFLSATIARPSHLGIYSTKIWRDYGVTIVRILRPLMPTPMEFHTS